MASEIVIDPDGDVCLRLPNRSDHADDEDSEMDMDATQSSSQEPSTVSLVVSSKALALASPVFKAMFSGQFKEGIDLAQAQAASQRYQLDLPEDKAEPMEILCNLIHAKMDRIPDSPSPSSLADLAILAEKYQCLLVLKYPGKAWLKPSMTSVPVRIDDDDTAVKSAIQALWLQLLFAYLVDMPLEYKIISAHLVMHSLGPHFTCPEPWSAHFRHDVAGMWPPRREAVEHNYTFI
jgi:hypothetical protein